MQQPSVIAKFLEKEFILRFLRFCVVGVSGTIVDFAITWLFRDIIGIHELIANAIGFTLAATNNYILNRIWTWGSHEKNVGVEYLKFFIVSLIGLGLNTLILSLLLHVFTFANDDLNFWCAKVVATFVVMLWNFLANNFFTFRKKEAKENTSEK
ncbi:MAG: GtrA family protein [Bacteroidales bacterium]|nr:GtrA family protein [Bacteroidales bacterium]